jgi:UDP-N-acetylmuramyl pentapeptide phosphotransferase/UDP-N-acetylglucosamine-1-phosphate transferase
MISIILILSIINLLIFINLNRFEKIINIYDLPDKKLKLHSQKTPILGGPILIINY